jgi:tyrosine-specific transport protein
MKKGDLKKTLTASSLVVGTVIGAGFLGIPSVVSKSGFYIGLFYLIFLGLTILLLNLMLGEVSLRTKNNHQLTGYANLYLGKTGKKLMFFTLIFEVYSAILAYLTGITNSISFLLFGEIKYILIIGIAIWLLMSSIISTGVRGMKRYLGYSSLTILALIFIISLLNFDKIDYSNITSIYPQNFFLPFGVILFAYLGFTSMPEVERHLEGKEKLLKKSLIIGSIIPMVLYILFTLVIVGVYGESTEEISTFSLGKFVVVLGMITMSTAYIALSVALKDMFMLDYGKSWKNSWITPMPERKHTECTVLVFC